VRQGRIVQEMCSDRYTLFTKHSISAFRHHTDIQVNNAPQCVISYGNNHLLIGHCARATEPSIRAGKSEGRSEIREGVFSEHPSGEHLQNLVIFEAASH
jgi:hypothetical protein